MWYLDFEYVICLEGQMKICLLAHENFVKLKLTTEDQKSFFWVIARGGSSIVKVPGDVPPARVYFFGLLV